MLCTGGQADGDSDGSMDEDAGGRIEKSGQATLCSSWPHE